MWKNATIKIGAALIALALLVVPALAVSQIDLPSRHLQISSQQTGGPSHLGMILLLLGSAGIAGAVTVTYLYPVSSTVPPTATQSSQTPTVTGLINWGADADTTALFTHNFGIATAAGFAGKQPNIAQGFPEVIVNYTGVSTVVASIVYTNTSGNVITFTKASLLGTAGTMLVTVRMPHSISL